MESPVASAVGLLLGPASSCRFARRPHTGLRPALENLKRALHSDFVPFLLANRCRSTARNCLPPRPRVDRSSAGSPSRLTSAKIRFPSRHMGSRSTRTRRTFTRAPRPTVDVGTDGCCRTLRVRQRADSRHCGSLVAIEDLTKDLRLRPFSKAADYRIAILKSWQSCEAAAVRHPDAGEQFPKIASRYDAIMGRSPSDR